MIKKFFILILLLSALLITGCKEELKPQKYPIVDKVEVKKSNLKSYGDFELDPSKPQLELIDSIVTEKKIIGLTINGLGNEASLVLLLDELDKYNIKATFFITGSEAIEKMDSLDLVVKKGHEIGSLAYTGNNLDEINLKAKAEEIGKGKEVIELLSKQNCVFFRTRYDYIGDELMSVASNLGHKYAIGFNIAPQDYTQLNNIQMAELVDEKKTRGSIISLNLEKYDDTYKLIPLIYNKLDNKHYKLVCASQLIPIYEQRKANKYHLEEDWFVSSEKVKCRFLVHGNKKDNKISMTFDDWGSEDTISEILDVLDEYNVKATFFVVGSVAEYNPSLAYAILKEGHEIANHTYSHPDLAKMNQEEIEYEIKKNHEVLTEILNEQPSLLFRPPKLSYDKKTILALENCGYKCNVMITANSEDYNVNLTSDQVLENSLKKLKGGSIILFHMLDNTHTPGVLDTFIEQARSSGYEFVTVGELLDGLPDNLRYVDDVF